LLDSILLKTKRHKSELATSNLGDTIKKLIVKTVSNKILWNVNIKIALTATMEMVLVVESIRTL
jgi:hypothetical protein